MSPDGVIDPVDVSGDGAFGLPGCPDIAFIGCKKANFVHGCFWHAHDCSKGLAPKSRLDYWQLKRQANINRDRTNIERLEARRWTFLIV